MSRQNQPRIGVGALIVKNGKFLIGRRKGSHGLDTWAVPGGWLEYQESFEAAAKREAFEETGLALSQVRFVGLTNNIFQDEITHSVTVWMLGSWESGDPQILEPDKFIDQKWVNFNTLPQPLFLPLQQLLKSEFITSIQEEIKK